MKNIFNLYKKVIVASTIVLLLLLTIVGVVYAKKAGKAGLTSTTSASCGNCHAPNSSSSVTLSVSSETGSFTVAPNSTTTFTITIYNSSLPNSGIDIGVKTTETGETNAGTLAPLTGSNLKLLSSELVQSVPVNFSGGKVDYSFTWTAPSTPGTYYLRAVGLASNNNNKDDSGDLWNWMTPQVITVSNSSSLTLSSPVGGETFCANSAQDIKWTSSGVTNVKIELSNDGGATYSTTLISSTPAASQSWTWNIPSNQTSSSQYRVRVSDVSNASLKSESSSNFTINPITKITTQPQNITVCEVSQAKFTVIAFGSSLTYQWRKNSNPIQGANQSEFIINQVNQSDAGDYDCEINSTCGTLTSSSATLIVNLIPTISLHPKSNTLKIGDELKLFVIASGNNLKYQWKKGNVNLANQNSDTLKISNVQLTDAGNYFCEVSNDCGKVVSQEAIIDVIDPTEAILSVDNLSYDFGKVLINKTKDTIIQVKNIGTKDLIINSIKINGLNAASFLLQNLTLPVNIQPNKTFTFVVSFNPLEPGQNTAQIEFVSNSKNNPIVNLLGYGAVVNLTKSVDSLVFTSENRNEFQEKSIEIKNNSNINVNYKLSLNGQNADDFSIKTDTIGTLNSNEKATFIIGYKPQINNSSVANLKILILESQDIINIPLIGTLVSSVCEEISITTLYPNPTNNKLNIENFSDANIISFEIYNYEGNKILSGNASHFIDVSSLPKGSYLLKLNKENRIYKFIKY
ncbi:MAG: choice-of-anchor V domain-containing protein [Candidatus Kapaibacteriota bacterium]